MKKTWYEIRIFKNGSLIDKFGEYETFEEAERERKFEADIHSDDKRIKVKTVKCTGTVIYQKPKE